MSSPVTGPPLIDSSDVVGMALREFFLANADRGDNAANDPLVTEPVRRIRAEQGASDGVAAWSRAARLAPRLRVVAAVGEPVYTIPLTCCLDGQAHDVTDESVAVGRRAGRYQALCGYVVMPASVVAPVGRPCARCTAVLASHRPTPTTAPVRRSRRRQRGRLWRMLHPHGRAAVGDVSAQSGDR